MLTLTIYDNNDVSQIAGDESFELIPHEVSGATQWTWVARCIQETSSGRQPATFEASYPPGESGFWTLLPEVAEETEDNDVKVYVHQKHLHLLDYMYKKDPTKFIVELGLLGAKQ